MKIKPAKQQKRASFQPIFHSGDDYHVCTFSDIGHEFTVRIEQPWCGESNTIISVRKSSTTKGKTGFKRVITESSYDFGLPLDRIRQQMKNIKGLKGYCLEVAARCFSNCDFFKEMTGQDDELSEFIYHQIESVYTRMFG